jgi:hypothetical protein
MKVIRAAKILFVFLFILSGSEVSLEAGLNFGLTGAIKARSKVIDQKIEEKLAETEENTAPAAPSNPHVRVVNNNSIEITWQDNSDNETGFKIIHSTDAVYFNPCTATGPNADNFTDTDVSADITYTYKICASNSIGDSAYTTAVSTRISSGSTATTAPAAPGSLVTLVQDSDSIEVEWSDNSNNETGFRLVRSTQNGGFAQCGLTDQDVAYFHDTDVTMNVTYYYKVCAFNSAGDSDYSAVSSTAIVPAPPPALPPETPYGLLGTATSSQVTLTWADVAYEQGYEIIRSTRLGNTGYIHISSVGANVTVYVDTGLMPCTLYDYKVRSFNSYGNSNYSFGHGTTTSREINCHYAWGYATGRPIAGSAPAVGDDGTIYFGTMQWDYDAVPDSSCLYALNPDHSLQWKYYTDRGYSITGSPAVDSARNNIYFVVRSTCSRTEDIISVSTGGDFRWKYTINGGLVFNPPHGAPTPAIGGDGTVYVNSKGTFAFDPNGGLKWHNDDGEIHSAPAINGNGTIYSVYNSTNDATWGVRAFDPDGKVKWTYPASYAWICASLAIAVDSSVYVGSDDGKLYAINPNGSQKWTFDTHDDGIRSTPVIGADGSVYLGSYQSFGLPQGPGKIYALDSGGNLKWKYDPVVDEGGRINIYASPVIGADETIYFMNENCYFYAFSADGRLKGKWHDVTAYYGGVVWSSLTILPNGIMLTGGLGGGLIAIQTPSMGMSAGSPWPKYLQNYRNTGRKE